MSTPTRSASRTARNAGQELNVDGTDELLDRIEDELRKREDSGATLDRAALERRIIGAIDQQETTARVREIVQTAATATSPALLSAIAEQEQRWRDIESRYGLLDSAQVADLTGSKARNRAGTASHLRTGGKALAVYRGGRYLFPGFQFTVGGQVFPVIPKVIEVMAEEGWQPESIVEWLDSPNGYLGGRTPVDRIADEAAVLTAAVNAANAGR